MLPNDPITIRTDSTNAIGLATGHSKYNKTTKWMDNRYFFIRDIHQKNLITFEYVDSVHNLAGGFTKPLAIVTGPGRIPILSQLPAI